MLGLVKQFGSILSISPPGQRAARSLPTLQAFSRPTKRPSISERVALPGFLSQSIVVNSEPIAFNIIFSCARRYFRSMAVIPDSLSKGRGHARPCGGRLIPRTLPALFAGK
jgi:hypothetical protein